MNQKYAAIYIRVSTEAQAEEGYSIEAQKERLQGYCVSKGIKEYAFYIDGGYSGSHLERPEINRLIEDARKKRLSHVIVYKLDRLSRSQKDTLYLIEDILNPNDVDFVSINESMDTSTPMGRLMLGILSAFAQLERENIRERTRMGMKERVKQGYWYGGGRVPFGYDYDSKSGTLVQNNDAPKVKQMYELYRQGYSAQKIAHMLGLKYDRLVMQILQRKSNTGLICYNGEEYKGRHQPIITPEEYNETMDLMESRRQKKTNSTNHLLTGLVYCAKCGSKMRYQKWGNNGYKLVCYSRHKSKAYLIKNANCDNTLPWANEIEEVVLQDIFQFALDKKKALRKKDKEDSPLEMLEGQKCLVEKELKQLYLLFAKEPDTILLEAIADQKKRILAIVHDIEREEKHKEITKKRKMQIQEVENISEVWDTMNISEKKRILFSVVEKVVIDGDRVAISYTI